jgi:hypothetical protein
MCGLLGRNGYMEFDIAIENIHRKVLAYNKAAK